MMSYKVRFWSIKTVKNRNRPHGVRWLVDGHESSEWFASWTQADHYRSQLIQCAERGEPFDTVTGLPRSHLRRRDAGTWYEHARWYAAQRWDGGAAKTRSTVADCLASVTRHLVTDRRGAPAPEVLHRALAAWAFNKVRMERQTPPPEISAALEWIERKSLPLAELADTEILERALKGIAVNLDGSRAAANSTRRRYGVFWSCMDWATKKKKVFEANPLNEVDWKPPETAVEVDPRQVPSPDQARALLSAVLIVAPQVGRHLYAFFACMYFAGLRPSEVVDLSAGNCDLPRSGWGLLRLKGSSPAAGKNWTDDGRYHEERGLKSRAEGTQRPVPACPELVVILRAHVEEFGTGDGGRLFRSQRGNRLAPVSYDSVWRRARAHALTPVQLATPLAERPYDLRHACLSLWLRSGVSEIEVAARAGHSVAMLQSTYAHCIDGDRDLMNKRIEDGLGRPGQGFAEHTEQAGAWSRDRGEAVPRLFRERRVTVTYSGGQRSTSYRPSKDVAPGGEANGEVDPADLGGNVRRLHSTG